MSPPNINTDDCWLFAGCKDVKGYGRIYAESKKYITHRVMYEAFKGEIPHGYHIDHLCRVPACCNPEHLEAVTPRENVLRGIGPSAIHARKTHCPQGHPLIKGNLMTRLDGRRQCMKCRSWHNRNYRDKVKIKMMLTRYFASTL